MLAQRQEKRENEQEEKEPPQTAKGMGVNSNKDKKQRQYAHVSAAFPKMPAFLAPPISLINSITKNIRKDESEQFFEVQGLVGGKSVIDTSGPGRELCKLYCWQNLDRSKGKA